MNFKRREEGGRSEGREGERETTWESSQLGVSSVYTNAMCTVTVCMGNIKWQTRIAVLQVEYLLSEWVRHFHQPSLLREGDRIYAAYVARVSSSLFLVTCLFIYTYTIIPLSLPLPLPLPPPPPLSLSPSLPSSSPSPSFLFPPLPLSSLFLPPLPLSLSPSPSATTAGYFKE